ncbi:MAG: bifunctional diaminohydroxyphosphoribosylaminopyrimidine deaminase/5-amino-6-(5-phosphoribosylamino)uracil reductase RibD [Pseudomonadota bacterium]
MGDADHMAAALVLAGRGLGATAPNPSVGCVLVKEGRVVGRGWTQAGGRPHAETEALARAGAAAEAATAYVTLEPCAHHGRTPPCADALIRAKIARCVVALEDPDGRVAGKGIALLKAAGVAVETGLLAERAAELNAGYLRRLSLGRPLVTLKVASSLDGRIATRNGESQWITGPQSRARAHLLRAQYDAVLVGSGTAVTDNPRLDVRLAGLAERSPVRVVLDGRLRLPLTHDLVARAVEQRTLLMTRRGNDAMRLEGYRSAGVEVVELEDDEDGNLSLIAALEALGARGMNNVLVEGGGHVAADLLRRRLADRLIWFRAPRMIGGDGLAAAVGFGLEELAATPNFQRLSALPCGEDVMETYRLVA